MHLMKSLLASALLVAAAVAQKISFTSFPEDVQAGEPVTVTWTGGSDEPVTITLMKGLSKDLQEVETLTTSGQDGTFTWTPESDIVNGDDYALRISQGDEVNYTNLFDVSGGSGKEETPSPTVTTPPPTVTGTSSPSSGPSNSRNSTSSEATTITTGVTVTPTGPTTAPPTPTPSEPSAASIMAVSSPFALIMGVLVAFVYLH
ncbi:extracellular matrix protein [Blastomyces gilchristii SLH14081]|uniref:Extracellular matrix protein n=1 Tax=Blastomyces gilchristii (strain SLH14081) TaxID=559298 RepID=A0A179UJQ2_BLAGS|nr:extracellular matrix protein [Blastomyces gilchristii SLH14081]OAT08214.1 extracellular matrix protein [Blastomyces gilchristii SLH14081]